MIIESVSPASEEDETHIESDLEEGYVEGVYICEASHCDTEENIHTRNDHKFHITEGIREIFIERVKGAIIKPTSHPEEYSEIDADAFEGCDSLQEILIPSHKTDYYKKRLPSELWDKIVELDDIKQ